MFSLILASLLSLSHLKQTSTDHLFQPSLVQVEQNRLLIQYRSFQEMKNFSNHIAYCLNKDIQGNFKPIDQTTQLCSGDILAFGSSSKDFDVLGIYQEEMQFLYIFAKNTNVEIALGSLHDQEWKKFAYRGFYRKKPLSNIQSIVSTPISWQEIFNSQFVNLARLPVILTPKNPKIQLSTYLQWTKTRQWQMQSLLNEYGALLLRNFEIVDARSFADVFSATVDREPMDYIGEGSRKKIVPGVYTSTEGPPEFHIPLHHELSCTKFPASYISFFCDIAPISGTGQTILGKTEDITQALYKKTDLWNFFKDKNIKYISRHPPEGNFFTKVNKTHKSWQEVFETSDKNEVERICHEKGLDFVWEGEWIKLTRIAPAICGPDRYFPCSYWYNQLHLYHANPRIRGGFFNHLLANLLYIDPSTRQYEVMLEDGTSIPQDIVYEIYDILEANTIKFDWKKGDVLVIDNRRILHGRAPTSGERRILASMTK